MRFTVRKMASGWTGVSKYYVYDLKKKQRVTVHAYLDREWAQLEADDLNISELVLSQAEDPRSYEERLAEARTAFYKEKGEKK